MYSNDLICDVIIYIDNNINDRIQISDLESHFHYDRYYLMKLFKKEINYTIIDYINHLRIFNSILYMRDHDELLLGVALKNGFNSLEYFSEIFKKVTYLTPSNFYDFFRNKKIDFDLYNKINESLTFLYEVHSIKDVYLSRRKRLDTPVMKLSLFNEKKT